MYFIINIHFLTNKHNRYSNSVFISINFLFCFVSFRFIFFSSSSSVNYFLRRLFWNDVITISRPLLYASVCMCVLWTTTKIIRRVRCESIDYSQRQTWMWIHFACALSQFIKPIYSRLHTVKQRVNGFNCHEQMNHLMSSKQVVSARSENEFLNLVLSAIRFFVK